MEVSVTTFVDYLYAITPTKRLSVVRDAKRQYELGYDAMRDFYLPLRQAVVAMHRGNRSPKTLDQVVGRVSKTKGTNYEECIKGYRKWLRGKTIQWQARPRAREWRSGDLTIIVNPELTLLVDGSREITKLHFKAQPLSRHRAAAALYLLRQSFGESAGILDVRRGRRYPVPANTSDDLALILSVEANSFSEIWKAL